MKSGILKIGLAFLVIGLIAYACFYNTINYGLMQASGQFHVLKDAKPIQYFLDKPDFPDSLKQKLRLLAKIKKYAIDSLKLPAENQYNTMYDQNGADILWVVTAAQPYELIDYKWNFPVLGEVSYKGFFDHDALLEEQQQLEGLGLDTRTRSVGAWSTLGWLDDPILSKMLERSEAKLAEVIFHELIHDVVYIEDSTDFNENLATFLGRKMAIGYLEHYHHDEMLLVYHNQLADAFRLNSFINKQLNYLDSVYATFNSLSELARERQKQQAFMRLKNALQLIPFNDEHYADFLLLNDSLNNSHLMAFDRYGGLQQELEAHYNSRFEQDVLKMLDFYRMNFNSL